MTDDDLPTGEQAEPEQAAASDSLAARARSSRPVKRSAAAEAATAGKGTAGKGVATRKRGSSAPTHGRTSPATFVEQSVGELKKVNWPTGDQLRQYFFVVLGFVLFIITFVGLLDLAFGWALLKLFGHSTPAN